MLQTKADTLLYLYDKIKKSHIEDSFVLTGKEYRQDKEAVLEKIENRLGGQTLIVRSSCSNEDGLHNSNAGHYLSILHVDGSHRKDVAQAIERVFASYDLEKDRLEHEQVLIQKETEHVRCSGVVFTRDVKADRPYYVISYHGGDTDIVTGGRGGKTLYVLRNTHPDVLPAEWKNLLEAVMEIEDIFPDYPLDIEFAVLENKEIVIFQVRPLAANMQGHKRRLSDEAFFELAESAGQNYRDICKSLKEENTILSDMAFWNPAEMIGENPHPLDYSLYREIITKSAWNQGLNYIGYQEVEGELMYRVANKPFVSLKQSFLCLTPENLDLTLVKKLIRYYTEKLKKDLSAHDKIEFEIVLSNYDLTTKEQLESLLQNGFSREEISDFNSALFHLTDQAVRDFKRNRMQDLRALNGLRVHRENIRSNFRMSCNDVSTLILYFIQLLESIKQYGTPKFARQARLAFIAKTLCRSLVEKGYFSKKEMDDFMMSVYTVASEYDADFQDYADGKITRASFNEKYGHLRSGTYDITCETYADRTFDISKGSSNAKKQRQKIEDLKHNPLRDAAMADALKQLGFFTDTKEFVEYLRDSMEEREYFKFEFTKSLSLAIDILIEAGKKMDISKEELAYLDVDTVFRACDQKEDDIKTEWMSVIEKNKRIYERNSLLILPDVLTSEQDIRVIEIREARPNFITSEIVSGEVVLLEEHDSQPDGKPVIDVRDKIVVIPKADPGYDWIFAKGIRGFITKYGGVASHMAIRCAEFSIPAAIGCGDAIYNYVSELSYLTLDCKNGKIRKEV